MSTDGWTLSGDPVAQKVLAIVERAETGMPLAKAVQRHPGAAEALKTLEQYGFVREILTTRKVMTGSRAEMAVVAIYAAVPRATPEVIEETEARIETLRTARRENDAAVSDLRVQREALRQQIRAKRRKRLHLGGELRDMEALVERLKAQRP